MKIILNNNAELTPMAVVGGRKNVQGANRDTLTFVFPAEMDMAELDGIFTVKNCESITVEGETGSYIHKGYTVRGELSKATVCVSAETEEAPAVYEDRIHVVMGQRTYTEAKMAEMEEALNMILEGVTDET
jgi:hypothetical protein